MRKQHAVFAAGTLRLTLLSVYMLKLRSVQTLTGLVGAVPWKEGLADTLVTQFGSWHVDTLPSWVCHRPTGVAHTTINICRTQQPAKSASEPHGKWLATSRRPVRSSTWHIDCQCLPLL